MSFGVAAVVGAVGSAAVGLYSANQSSNAARRATNAATDAANEQAALGREQLDLARQQFRSGEARQARMDPLYEQLMRDAIADGGTARSRSADQWEQYTRIFQPLEAKMAETAANYDTVGRRMDAAAEAAATVGKAFDNTRSQQQRSLARAGVQIGSGRALTMDNDSRLEQAKAQAGADIQARRAVEDRGIALVDNAARFGRNQTSTSLQAAGMGLQANGVAQNAGISGINAANAALQPGMSLMGMGSGNIAQSGNVFANIAQQQNVATGNAYAGIGSALTSGAYLYGRNQMPGLNNQMGIGSFGADYTSSGLARAFGNT